MESHNTQEASRGDEGQDRDLTPDGVGESKTRRGEDMMEEEGKEPGRYDSGTQGKPGRPVGAPPPATRQASIRRNRSSRDMRSSQAGRRDS